MCTIELTTNVYLLIKADFYKKEWTKTRSDNDTPVFAMHWRCWRGWWWKETRFSNRSDGWKVVTILHSAVGGPYFPFARFTYIRIVLALVVTNIDSVNWRVDLNMNFMTHLNSRQHLVILMWQHWVRRRPSAVGAISFVNQHPSRSDDRRYGVITVDVMRNLLSRSSCCISNPYHIS